MKLVRKMRKINGGNDDTADDDETSKNYVVV
jgi:hypothetical protein